MLKKNIISLKPDFEWSITPERYNKNFGTVYLDITKDDQRKIDKGKLVKELEISKSGYDKYISTYIQIDSNEVGIHKVIKSLNSYFTN